LPGRFFSRTNTTIQVPAKVRSSRFSFSKIRKVRGRGAPPVMNIVVLSLPAFLPPPISTPGFVLEPGRIPAVRWPNDNGTRTEVSFSHGADVPASGGWPVWNGLLPCPAKSVPGWFRCHSILKPSVAPAMLRFENRPSKQSRAPGNQSNPSCVPWGTTPSICRESQPSNYRWFETRGNPGSPSFFFSGLWASAVHRLNPHVGRFLFFFRPSSC